MPKGLEATSEMHHQGSPASLAFICGHCHGFSSSLC